MVSPESEFGMVSPESGISPESWCPRNPAEFGMVSPESGICPRNQHPTQVHAHTKLDTAKPLLPNNFATAAVASLATSTDPGCGLQTQTIARHTNASGFHLTLPCRRT